MWVLAEKEAESTRKRGNKCPPLRGGWQPKGLTGEASSDLAPLGHLPQRGRLGRCKRQKVLTDEKTASQNEPPLVK